MPDLDPGDLDRLDEAFDSLTHDIARGSRAPGAPGAMRLARRRRATSLGAAVAVLALGVGGLAWGQSGRDDASPDVANPRGVHALPDPAPLDLAGLDRSTERWQGPWRASDEGDAGGSADFFACLEGLEQADPGEEPKNGEMDLVRSATGTRAFVTLGEFGTAPAADRYARAIASSYASCAAASAAPIASYRAAQAWHFRVTATDGLAEQEAWIVQWDRRIGYLVAESPATGAASSTVSDRVVSTLLAAIRVDDPSPEGDGDGSASAGSDEESKPGPESSTEVPDRVLVDALKAWDPAITADPSAPRLPCLDVAASTASSGSSHLIAERAEVWTMDFESVSDAAASLDTLDQQMASCNQERWTITDVSGPMVGRGRAVQADSATGAMWAMQSGRRLVVLTAESSVDPMTPEGDDVLELVIASSQS